MNKLIAYYGSLTGLFLIAPGYFYVNAYFSFFGMEEVINELGVAYFIQKSSLIWSGVFHVFSDNSIGIAYLEFVIWLTLSVVFYQLYVRRTPESGHHNPVHFQLRKWLSQLLSKVKKLLTSPNSIVFATVLSLALVSVLASFGNQFIAYALILFGFTYCAIAAGLTNGNKGVCTVIIRYLRTTVFGFLSMVHHTIRVKPTTLGRALVALPIVFGVYNVSQKMGGIYAWKLVHKELPYYSQVEFPELESIDSSSIDGNAQYLALTALKKEMDDIRDYFKASGCSQFNDLQAEAADSIRRGVFDNYERFDFSIYRSHFRKIDGSGGVILLEVYRTDRWIYLTSVMSTLDEEHFTLRIRPDVFGFTRTQIKTNTDHSTREFPSKSKFYVANFCLDQNGYPHTEAN